MNCRSVMEMQTATGSDSHLPAMVCRLESVLRRVPRIPAERMR